MRALTPRAFEAVVAEPATRPFQMLRFDGVFCSNLLEHTPEPLEPVIAEIERVLKAGRLGVRELDQLAVPVGRPLDRPLPLPRARLGTRVYRRLFGELRERGIPYEDVWPISIGAVLRSVRERPGLEIERAVPRYYPSQSWILRVPGLREVLTWNCLLLLRRRPRPGPTESSRPRPEVGSGQACRPARPIAATGSRSPRSTPIGRCSPTPTESTVAGTRTSSSPPGKREVAERLAVAAELGLPRSHGQALDFGCGLGRTARELAARFDRCVGLDITEAMLTRARELNAHLDNLDLVRADGSEPLPFADETFDAVYSSIVLQHLPSTADARAAIGELARVTAAGGLLCFQLPTALGLAVRLQPRRTAYKALRAVRVPERVLYERLGLHPIRMLALPRAEVESILGRSGLEVRAVDEWRDPVWGFSSAVYYASR